MEDFPGARVLSRGGWGGWLFVEGCGAFSRAATPAADCMTLINYALECARTAVSVHLNEDIFVG